MHFLLSVIYVFVVVEAFSVNQLFKLHFAAVSTGTSADAKEVHLLFCCLLTQLKGVAGDRGLCQSNPVKDYCRTP